MYRALWVEDELRRNKPFIAILYDLSFKIRFASSVTSAFTLLEEEHSFDIALIDLNLPLGADNDHLGLTDCNLNGKYILDKISTAHSSRVKRVFCITNHWEEANESLGNQDTELIRKSISLKDFTKLIKGSLPSFA